MDGGRIGSSTRAARICLSGLTVLATLAMSAVPQAAADPAPAWTKIRFDAGNTAFNSSETWLSPANVTSLAQDWSAQINPKESPLVGGGVIYVGCKEEFFCALDATNGAVRWTTHIGPIAPFASATLADGVLYTIGYAPAVTAFTGSPLLMALDAGTGAVVWKTLIMNGCCGGPLQPLPGDVPRHLNTPVAVAEGLIVQRWNHSLLAWDAATGIERWVVPVAAGGIPAIVNGVVYVQTDGPSPTLYALRATTGETLWTSQPATGEAGATIVSSGLVIVASDQTATSGRLSAYPAAGCATSQCQPIWRKDVSPAPTGSGAVAGGVLYQGLGDGSYAALDTSSGRLLWKTATAGAGRPTGAATVANGVLFGQAGGYVDAWSATGCGTSVCQPLWSTPLGGDMWPASDTIVAQGRVYVVNDIVANEAEYGTLRVFSPRLNPPPALSPPPVQPVGPTPVRTLSTTLNVPTEYLSIQRAIDASIPGDVVLVAPGVYHERIDFHGHAVEVRSAGGPEVTIIDGDGVSAVVGFEARETRDSVLRGFTIRNGAAADFGGGVRVAWSSPTIIDNVITGNRSYGSNGIYVTGGGPAIVGNQVRDNHTLMNDADLYTTATDASGKVAHLTELVRARANGVEVGRRRRRLWRRLCARC